MEGTLTCFVESRHMRNWKGLSDWEDSERRFCRVMVVRNQESKQPEKLFTQIKNKVRGKKKEAKEQKVTYNILPIGQEERWVHIEEEESKCDDDYPLGPFEF